MMSAGGSIMLLESLLAQCRTGTVAGLPRPLAQCRTGMVAGLPPRSMVMSAADARVPTPAPVPAPTRTHPLRFVDIGVNLLDSMFDGEYRGKRAHPPDLDDVLARAWEAGVEHAIVTAGTLEESRKALALVRRQRAANCPVQLYSTVGVHPTRSLEFLPPDARAEVEAAMEAAAAEPAGLLAQQLAEVEEQVLGRPAVVEAMTRHTAALREVLDDGAIDGAIVAVGECGLDYDRLMFCPRLVQRASFELQLQLGEATGQPLFLHNRATGGEFATVCAANSARLRSGGVVHSFDGGLPELDELLAQGLHIGLNGCSLKTPANLEVAAAVPLSALHLETDAPWCAIKRTHAGHTHVRPLLCPATGEPYAEEKKERWRSGACVKDRCEPCHINGVLQVVSAMHGGQAAEADVAHAAFDNSVRLFRLPAARHTA